MLLQNPEGPGRSESPKVSKGSEELPPPVADKGSAQEAIEKEQCKLQRGIVTIEMSGLTGKPWSRPQTRNHLQEQRSNM